MKLDRFIRVALGGLLALLFVIGIAAVVFITESALNVWDRLVAGPPLLLYSYVAALLALVALAVWLVVRLLVRRSPGRGAKGSPSSVLTRDDIEARLRTADNSGVDAEAARAELAELATRQAEGSVHLCFFGEISSGKSSLIKALVPDATVTIDVIGGSTSDIRHYRWRDDDGSRVLLTDVPGTAGLEEALSTEAEEEARRAQVVLYICDGDLTRAEKDGLRWLLALGKPTILVMNKSDRYSAEEQALLMERLFDHVADLGGDFARDRVVAVSAGGETDVIERLDDGSERPSRRRRAADVGVLVVAINRLLDSEAAALDSRRDRAVFELAAEKLAVAEQRYRQQRSEQIVRSSTRKAVVGALAAISPGTDVLIQGYVGTAMTRELCGLYGVMPRDLDIEEFLSLSESRAGKALPLALAVAGNGLKAFPGIGTVAGGLVHAVAYGLIFDALGHSLVRTLDRHGALVPEAAASEFEESIGEHIEACVRQVAKIAVAETQGRDRGDG